MRFGERDVARLLGDPGIVRNRLKVESAIANARAILALGSFDRYVWSFVDGKPLVGRWKSMRDVPATTDMSRALSRELKRAGFRFVGPTVCYSFMQATGMVNDHTVDCYRFAELTA